MATSGYEVTDILQELIVDDAYRSLKDRFNREGKGRRPDASPPPLTNLVLVQLWSLMLSGGFEQKKVVDWYGYLYGNDPSTNVPADRVRRMVSSAYTKAVQLSKGPRNLVVQFLNSDFEFVSGVLSGVHLTRASLLGDTKNYSKSEGFCLNNEIALELEKFQNLEHLNFHFTAKWICFLKDFQCDVSDKRSIQNLKHKIKKLKKDKIKLQTKKAKDPDSYERFLKAEFLIPKPTSQKNNSTINDQNDQHLNVITDIHSCQRCLELAQNVELINGLLETEKRRVLALEKELDGYDKLKAANEEIKIELKNLKRRAARQETKLEVNKEELKSLELKRKLDVNDKDKAIEQLETKKMKVSLLEKECKSTA